MFSNNKKSGGQETRQSPAVTAGATAKPTQQAPKQAAPGKTAEVPRLEATQARIGATVTIEGEIRGEENLQIDGTVKGSVVFEQHRVVISDHGLVEGEVKADVIEVFGKCKGEIHGRSQVTVYENGEVQGDISAPRVALESGARFKGSVDMGDEDRGPAFTTKELKSTGGTSNTTDEKSLDKSKDEVYGLNHVS